MQLQTTVHTTLFVIWLTFLVITGNGGRSKKSNAYICKNIILSKNYHVVTNLHEFSEHNLET